MIAAVEAMSLLASVLSGIFVLLLGRRKHTEGKSGTSLVNALNDVKAKIEDTRQETEVAAAEVGGIAQASSLKGVQVEELAELSQRIDGIVQTVNSLPQELEKIRSENGKSARDSRNLGIALGVFSVAASVAIALFVHPIS